jgi:hypothetical protein
MRPHRSLALYAASGLVQRLQISDNSLIGRVFYKPLDLENLGTQLSARSLGEEDACGAILFRSMSCGASASTPSPFSDDASLQCVQV